MLIQVHSWYQQAILSSILSGKERPIYNAEIYQLLPFNQSNQRQFDYDNEAYNTEEILKLIKSIPFKKVDFNSQIKLFKFAKKNFISFKATEFLENILLRSNLDQIDLLWTILQPVCHRDFH